MLLKEDYEDYCKRFKIAWNFLKSHSKPRVEVIKDICSIRQYDYARMSGILNKADFIFINEGTCDFSRLANAGSDLALFTKEGNFLLNGRYIFPVKDMLGNILALIGWYPDEKKYVTTPSKLFSKDCLFYGMEQLSSTGIGQNYVLVEGIFDCLSVRSLGIPCIAQMGISSSRYKVSMYTMFKSLLAIPDNDTQGRKVVNMDTWSIPRNGKYMRWKGAPIKDIDKLINSYQEDDVAELLSEVWESKDRIVTVEL